MFGWEQEHLLGGGWTCVGFSAHLPEPGAERAWRLGAGRVRLARDGDGTVRAWACAGERELPVSEWHGLVFVDGSGRAEPLGAALATIEDLVAQYEPERLVIAARRANATLDSGRRRDLLREMQLYDFDQGGYLIPAYIDTLDAYSTKITGWTTSRVGQPLSSFGFENFAFTG